MRRMLPFLLLIPAVVVSIFWWRAEQGRLEALDRVAQLEARQSLAVALRSILPPHVEMPPGTAAPPSVTRVAPPASGVDPAEYLRTIDELRERLKELSVELSAARDAVARAEETLAAEQAESKKVRAQLDTLREDLAASRRLADAVQVELRSKADRLVRAETAEKLALERAARAETAASKVAAAAKEIEDINRRREAVLTSLLRRYREVNDLYRNFTLNAQTRDTPAVAGLQAGDLSRIQSAIQQAEEDLRQVQSLNARMAQLTKVR